MQTLSKAILALCVCLFLAGPPATAQTAGDPEIKQIMKAAKSYAKGSGGTEDRFDFKFKKRVGDYALVQNYPKPKIQSEGADIILKKVGGKWVGQDMGTGLFEWEEKIPELFK